MNKVMIATPAFAGQCSMIFADCLEKLSKAFTDHGVESQIEYICNESILHKGRNYLAHRFMESDCSHMFFIDADMAFKAEDGLTMLKANKDVIAGAGPRKMMEWKRIIAMAKAGFSEEVIKHASSPVVVSMFENTNEITYDQPFPVKGVGTAFMLIKRNVFEKIKVRSSKIPTPFLGDWVNVPMWFDNDVVDGNFVSEDYTFCKYARKAGFEIHLAPWVILKHIGTHVFEGCLWCSNGSVVHEKPKPT